jgi:Protein of unknown function (DUF1570)
MAPSAFAGYHSTARTIAVWMGFAVWPVLAVNAQGGGKELVSLTVGKRQVEGQLLAADSQTVVLLRREGSMNFIPRDKVAAIEPTGRRFTAQAADLLRASLQTEFGAGYSVSQTAHFVVVHPPGDFQNWATPFEDLFLRFGHYFSSRGFAVPEPDFPLVAVVLNSRAEFDRFLSQHQPADAQVLGYYAPRSNRIITYRQTVDGGGQLQDLSTIVHEAAHQTAFNTGIHTRFAACPLWISEGLATMFEARGVHSSAWYGRVEERIHSGRLQLLLALAARKGEIEISELVQRDDLFRSDPDYAYSLAWGLTFYLAETQPREYFDFLRSTARAEHFAEYGSVARLEDFSAAFGSDFKGLNDRMWQYLRKLPVK